MMNKTYDHVYAEVQEPNVIALKFHEDLRTPYYIDNPTAKEIIVALSKALNEQTD